MVITDQQIVQEVSKALQKHPLMDLSAVKLEVLDGIVYLRGSVKTYIQKPLAYEIAGRISGVRNLSEELKVVFDAPPPADAAIEAFIHSLFTWQTTLKTARVLVNVNRGHVTVTGSVNSYFQKRKLIHALEDVEGVTGISDEIKILSPHDPPHYHDVLHVLQCCATVDICRLRVALDNREVTLTGFATSIEEKRDAERAVWSVPGVTEVDNRIVVNYMSDLAY